MEWSSLIIGLDEGNCLLDYANPRFCDRVWMIRAKTEEAFKEFKRRLIEENFDTFGLENWNAIYSWDTSEDIWREAQPIAHLYEIELNRLKNGMKFLEKV